MICGICKTHDVEISHVRACSDRRNNPNPQTMPAAQLREGYRRMDAHLPELAERERETPRIAYTLVERLRMAADKLPDVETAHYATRVVDESVYGRGTGEKHRGGWEFYRVDKPQSGKWKGYTFVKRQSGDDYYPLSFDRSRRVLEAIAADVDSALAEYGHQIGRCGVCNRTLTDPESIARGIGPVCAERIHGLSAA